MRKRDAWIERVKAVEAEYLVAAQALDVLSEQVQGGGVLLSGRRKVADLNRTRSNLEGTYFVRLFAVFEAGLRDAWYHELGRDTVPPMRDLLDAFASAKRIDGIVLRTAHQVREYRNSLVHEQDEPPTKVFPIGHGRRHLTRFFSHLPPDW